jgi:hypothetical protein
MNTQDPQVQAIQHTMEVPPRAPEEAAAKLALPRVRWQPAFGGTLAQLPY